MLDFSIYPRFNHFQLKTILAIDFGQKVTGTALFCPGRDLFPYMGKKIIYKSHPEILNELALLVEEENVDILVLGIPYFTDGKESETTMFVKNFGKLIQLRFPELQFFEQDETLTTVTAKERMLTSPQFNFKIDLTMVDCLSAVIILEDFIRDS